MGEKKIKPISQLDLSEKKVIIFDLDGTVINSVGVWDEIDQRLIEHFCGRVIDLETIQKQRNKFIKDFVGAGDDLYPAYGGWLNEFYNFNSSAAEVWNWRLGTAMHYLGKIFNFNPYVKEVIKGFKQKGFKLALATNSIQGALDIMKKNENFKDDGAFDSLFDLIVSSSDVQKRKPAPDVYLKIFGHFGVSANECLTFEDALDGVQAAKAAGIEVVNIYEKHSDHNRAEINKLADYAINSFKEILNLFF